MQWLINQLEIKVFQLARYLIIRGYGKCEMMDYEDFPKYPRELNAQGRCPACQATEVCIWLDSHISLLREW